MRLAVLLVIFSQANCIENLVKNFIASYFADENVVVTGQFCWTTADIITIIKTFEQLRVPKRFELYNDRDEENLRLLQTYRHFLVDARDCEESKRLFKKAEEKTLFRKHIKWLILIKENEFKDLLENIKILPDSSVVFAFVKNNSVELRSAYKISASNTEYVWEICGKFSKNSLSYIHSIRNNRLNLHGTLLKTAMITSKIGKICGDKAINHPDLDTFAKQDMPTAIALFNLINATYSLSCEISYGYFNRTTGKYDGIFEKLITNQIDITASSLVCSIDRLKRSDCIRWANRKNLAFVMRQPPLSSVENILKTALNDSIWVSVILVAITFTALFFIVVKWENRFHSEHLDIKDVSLVSLEAICQQGTVMEPKSASGRIMILIIFIAFMFIYVAYSAQIVVLLQSRVTLRDLKDLLDSPLEVGAENTFYMPLYIEVKPSITVSLETFIVFIFQHSNNPIKQKIFSKKITSKGYYKFEDGMERVRKGFFAFHVEMTPAYHYIFSKFNDYEVCGLQELEAMENFEAYTLIPKYSPYKNIFSIGLIRVREVGLETIHTLRQYSIPKCYSNIGNFESVGILETYQAMLIISCSIFASIIVLSLEMLHRYLKRTNVAYTITNYRALRKTGRHK